MSRIVHIAIAVSLTGVLAFAEQQPTLGSKFKKKWAAGKEKTLCMTHPAQLDPCVEQTFDGIKFRLAYNDQTHRVTYLYTDDPNFRTTDGLKVGDSIPMSRDGLRALPGWEIRAPMTPDGWWPVVGVDLPRIKLKDGSLLDITNMDKLKESTDAVIIGFAKGRP